MSQQKDTAPLQSETEVEDLDARPVPEEDWLLQEVVRLINHVEGMSIGITLSVSGGIVTGDLISLKEFFHEYAKLWRQGFQNIPELAETFEKQWREHGDKTSRELKERNEVLFSYIHLKNARYFFGVTAVPNPGGMLWRGRISEVSGFSLGSFGAPKAK